MAERTGIKNVKAADPGVAFDLELEDSQLTADQIRVELHVRPAGNTTMEHMSTITFNGPITEDTHCMVLPYGCAHYPAGGNVEYKVKVIFVKADDYTSQIWLPGENSYTRVTADPGKFYASQLTAVSIPPP